jgi:hypothetical protein
MASALRGSCYLLYAAAAFVGVLAGHLNVVALYHQISTNKIISSPPPSPATFPDPSPLLVAGLPLPPPPIWLKTGLIRVFQLQIRPPLVLSGLVSN